MLIRQKDLDSSLLLATNKSTSDNNNSTTSSNSNLNATIETSNVINFDFYNPFTKEKLNKTICNEIKVPISIPFKKANRLNMNLYDRLKVFPSLDAYNANSQAFHSRCFKSTSLDSDADVSINYRRTNYFQNVSISCSEKCKYVGLDQNKYVVCNCDGLDGEDNSNSGLFESMLALPQFNYDISLCYNEVFTDVNFCFFNYKTHFNFFIICFVKLRGIIFK